MAMRANEMWFIEPGGEPLTFREVFLKSAALENIVAGEASQAHSIQAAFAGSVLMGPCQ